MNSSAPSAPLPRTEIRLSTLAAGSTKPTIPSDGYHSRKKSSKGILRRLRENPFAFKAMASAFRVLQRAGITVTPNHFYWPVPDVRDLESRPWIDEAVPVGVDLNLEKQLSFLRTVVSEYQAEWSFPEQESSPIEYHYNNGLFETVDAEITYSFVRQAKPARIVEVGGGYSTRVMAAALAANRTQDNVHGELVTVEPFPGPDLHKITKLVHARIQDVDMDLFLSLGDGDILFLDSSHVVSVGSDVVREYLEILPRLRPGVIVHIHDIFLPSDYPREAVLSNMCFWSEQYVLQAFLTFNNQFEVLWASSAMQQYHSDALAQAFPRWDHSYSNMEKQVRQFLPTADGDRVWPSSFWIRRV